MLPCISELKFEEFKGLKPEYTNICTLELTVATGLEEVAAQECREKLNMRPQTFRGRIITDVEIETVSEVLKLRSIENVNVVIHVESSFKFPSDREECFQKLYQYVKTPDWRKGIKVWRNVFKMEEIGDPFEGEAELKETCCVPKPEVDLKLMKIDCSISGNLSADILAALSNKQNDKLAQPPRASTQDKEIECSDKGRNEEYCVPGTNENVKKRGSEQRLVGGPKFRVTCHRVGSTHIFGSSEAARQFGGGVNDRFGWPVDLSHYDLEVLLSIIEGFVYVGFSITKEPLFKRNLTHFGPTNLRSTICYSMIQLAKPQIGDIVVDPMCGGCSIPIEGTLSYNRSFYLGGDNFEAAVTRSRLNISHLVNKEKKSLAADALQWDATALPIRDQTVDVVVCDLPFGKRIGSTVDNRVLYFKSLVELARVTKVETGRAVLLTHDKKSITKPLLQANTRGRRTIGSRPTGHQM